MPNDPHPLDLLENEERTDPFGPSWEWTNGHGVTHTAFSGFDVHVLQRAAEPERRSHLRPVVRNPALRASAMLPGETVEQAKARQRVRDARQ